MTDTELEDRVRRTLRAVADAAPLDATQTGSPRRGRWLVVAACVALVAGGIAVVRALDTPDTDVRATIPDPTPTVAPSPLPATFDLRTASPVFVADGDPDEVAERYLQDRFPDHPQPGVQVEPVQTEGGEGRTRWSTGSELEGTLGSGDLFLRFVDGRWSVIASTTDGLDLSTLAYDGERITGTIRSSSDESFEVELRDWRADPTHDGSAPTHFGPAQGTVQVDARHPLQPVSARITHVGGTVLAMAEVRFDPPPLPRHQDLDRCIADHTTREKIPTPDIVARLCAASLDGNVLATGSGTEPAWELVASDEPNGHWVTLRWRDLVGSYRLQADGGFDSLFTQLGPCCAMGTDIVVAGTLNAEATGMQVILSDGRAIAAQSFPDPASGVQHAVVIVAGRLLDGIDTTAQVQVRIGDQWRDAAEINVAILGG